VAILITGVDGQDGSYLAEQLLAAGERLVGMVEPGRELPGYIDAMRDAGRCELTACDLRDPAAFRQLLRLHQPEKVFHLAAISHPLVCEEQPAASRSVNVTSIEVLFDWLRRERPESRVLVASSAVVFGDPAKSPQNEETPPDPKSEYARQKQAVREMAAAVREQGLFTACAIPFNHESPRRTEDFVFAKVCYSAARIKRGEQAKLSLGNMDVARDWGYAPEYATAMAWMLDIDRPTELVLATGEAHTVRELAETACKLTGLDFAEVVESDPALARKSDAAAMAGDATRAWDELGWEATTKFDELVKLMVDAESGG